MKKILYIATGVALLVALFFAGKAIRKQAKISNYVEILSNGYVYVSVPYDAPPYATPEDMRPRQVKSVKAFWRFHHTASDRRVRKEMQSESPSMRVYAFLSHFIRTTNVDFDYLARQLKLWDVIKYTDLEIREYDCFACDAMLYCLINNSYLSLFQQPDSEYEHNLSESQADSLLNIMYLQSYPVTHFRDRVAGSLDRIANERK
jgi:hypothetical protein